MGAPCLRPTALLGGGDGRRPCRPLSREKNGLLKQRGFANAKAVWVTTMTQRPIPRMESGNLSRIPFVILVLLGERYDGGRLQFQCPLCSCRLNRSAQYRRQCVGNGYSFVCQ